METTVYVMFNFSVPAGTDPSNPIGYGWYDCAEFPSNDTYMPETDVENESHTFILPLNPWQYDYN